MLFHYLWLPLIWWEIKHHLYPCSLVLDILSPALVSEFYYVISSGFSSDLPYFKLPELFVCLVGWLVDFVWVFSFFVFLFVCLFVFWWVGWYFLILEILSQYTFNYSHHSHSLPFWDCCYTYMRVLGNDLWCLMFSPFTVIFFLTVLWIKCLLLICLQLIIVFSSHL